MPKKDSGIHARAEVLVLVDESNAGTHWRCDAFPDPREGSTSVQELFQSDFAHGLVAHDLADFQAFDRQLALLVVSADHFGADRVCFFAQAI